MKNKIITQADKQHNVNALHDAFIAAGITPLRAESNETESRFAFDDSIQDSAIDAAIAAYSFTPPPIPVDIKQKWQAYVDAVDSATTVPQLKTAMTTHLRPILRELLRARIHDL